MTDLLVPSYVLLGVVFGAVICWFLARAQLAAQIDAAVTKAEMASQSELSELRERGRASDETRRTEQANSEFLKRQGEGWRGELEGARDEIAKLTERVSRVPDLESEVAKLTDQLRRGTEEVRRLSGEVGQKGQAVTSLTDQAQALEAEKLTLERKLNTVLETLNSANERKAALEEQSARLPGLEQALSAANRQLEQLNEKLTELREANGAEVASHQAERNAHVLTRDGLATEKAAHSASVLEVSRISALLTDLRESNGAEVSRLNAELNAEREAHVLVGNELIQVRAARDNADFEVVRLNSQLTELKTRFESEREAASEKLTLLLQAKDALSDQFKSLANDILEEKSKRFAEQNQATLGQLLDPLKTQLTEFKGKVEEVYVQEGKDRSTLVEQVRQLVSLNQTLSLDAQNLTRALKGNVKMQGNWGELVLERVLEASGLRKGFEYDVQESQKREDGTRGQADVIIHLPAERSLVVDSKVSLVAYESYVGAETEDDRTLAIRRHLDSVKGHIKGLSAKQYQSLYGLKQLDFVLLFVPIEPAFMLAATNDNELFMDAWNKNVLLVSPSTLLFVVRTVAHLWRQEAQSRNAQDIAKRGAELYDRLCDFVKDLTTVGDRLRSAQEAYDSAHKRLTTNRGNVIRQAEMLRDLGVKPTKSLPIALIDKATQDEDIVSLAGMAALGRSNTSIESADSCHAPVADVN